MNHRFLIDTLSGVFDEDAEFIPLMSQEDEDKINKEETPVQALSETNLV